MKDDWYDATIVDVREVVRGLTRYYTEVRIGYRIYSNDRDSIKRDSNEKYFLGYGEKVDVWLPLYDPRIRAINPKRWDVYEKRNNEYEKYLKDNY